MMSRQRGAGAVAPHATRLPGNYHPPGGRVSGRSDAAVSLLEPCRDRSCMRHGDPGSPATSFLAAKQEPGHPGAITAITVDHLHSLGRQVSGMAQQHPEGGHTGGDG